MELGVRLDSLTLPTCHPEQSSARPQHSYYSSYYHYHCSYLLVPAVPSILRPHHYYYYSYYHHHYPY